MASTEVLPAVDAMDINGASRSGAETRRSARLRKAPTRYDKDDWDGGDDSYHPSPQKKQKTNGVDPASSEMRTPRQRRAKTAAEEARAAVVAAYEHKDIVAESLAPMTAEERQEWDSWIELESEPVS
jgi:hypothetical protein